MEAAFTLAAFLLQAPRIEWNGKEISIRLKRAAAVLYYVIVKQTVTREELAALIWPEENSELAHRHLRDILYYHHIHEVDCIQFIMGPATEVTMTGGNVAHKGEQFGDEDDMLFLNLEFGNNTYALIEYGSAFHWPEHYVLIQGTEGAIRIDMCNVGMTVKTKDGKEEHYLVHETQEEDDDRTRIYHSTEMDGAIQYGHPGKKPPLWLHGIMKNEMKYFNGIMHGEPVPDEFRPLMTGQAARAAIATADAAMRSLREDRKVKVSEITG